MKFWKTKSGHLLFCILSGRSNVFLLSYMNKNILIDTSTGKNWKRLDRRLTKLNIQKIDFLILTHTHFDHAANSAKLSRVYGAKVIVHTNESAYLKNGHNVMPNGTNFFSRFLVNILAPILSYYPTYEPCQPDIIVEQHLDLNDFGFNGYVFHTPGHSTGSQSVIIDDEIALVGDTMFGIFRRSIFPPFADNVIDMKTSWGKLLKTNCHEFLPSHGSSISLELLQKEVRERGH